MDNQLKVEGGLGGKFYLSPDGNWIIWDDRSPESADEAHAGLWYALGRALTASAPVAQPQVREIALLNTLRDTIKEWLEVFLFIDGKQDDKWDEGHQAAIKQAIQFIENDDDTDDFSVKLSKILEAAKEEMPDEEMDIAEKIITAAASQPQAAPRPSESLLFKIRSLASSLYEGRGEKEYIGRLVEIRNLVDSTLAAGLDTPAAVPAPEPVQDEPK